MRPPPMAAALAMCGQQGSDRGCAEAPSVACPCCGAALAAHCERARTRLSLASIFLHSECCRFLRSDLKAALPKMKAKTPRNATPKKSMLPSPAGRAGRQQFKGDQGGSSEVCDIREACDVSQACDIREACDSDAGRQGGGWGRLVGRGSRALDASHVRHASHPPPSHPHPHPHPWGDPPLGSARCQQPLAAGGAEAKRRAAVDGRADGAGALDGQVCRLWAAGEQALPGAAASVGAARLGKQAGSNGAAADTAVFFLA